MLRRSLPLFSGLLLIALPLGAAPEAVFTADLGAGLAEVGALAAHPRDTARVQAAAEAIFDGERWRAADPTLARASRLDVQVFRVGRHQVARGRAYVDGLRVEGADRRLVFTEGALTRARTGAALEPRGAHLIGTAEATARAVGVVKGALFTDPTVERIGGLALPVWLARGDALLPAYRVRVPTLSVRDLKDVWVHGESGAILKTQRVGRFADGGTDGGVADGGFDLDAGLFDDGGLDAGDAIDAGGDGDGDGDVGPAPTAADIFMWRPAPSGVDDEDLVRSDLIDLADAAVGSPLVGKHFATYNCCKKHVCLDGSAACNMNDPAEARCATPFDEDPLTSEIAVVIPGDTLPPQLPVEELYAKTVFCAELPRVVSQPANGGEPAGWFENPVDATVDQSEVLALASEEDAFSEVQAYAAVTRYFQHIRDTLDDQTWCLGGDSMPCDANGDLLDVNGEGDPVYPFHVTVNGLRPEINLDEVLVQFLGGAGQAPGNPIVLQSYAREDVAVFLPALSSGLPGLDIPEQLSALTEIFTREFDSIVMFQGNLRDFAYDGTLMAHELGHAALYNFVADLDTHARDDQGSNASPGAIQEALVDYLAASWADAPDVSTYASGATIGGETGPRNLGTPARCPDDIEGDPWGDSRLVSNALWRAREAASTAVGPDGIRDLDAAVWLTMAELDADERFNSIVPKLITNVSDAVGPIVGTALSDALTDNNVANCERVYNMAVLESGQLQVRPKGRLIIATPNQIQTANMSPAAVQFRIDVPAGSSGFSMVWDQRPQLSAEFSTGEPIQPSVLAHNGPGPIQWVYTGANMDDATPRDANGNEINFEPLTDANQADVSNPERPTFARTFDPGCEDQTFWVQLINTGNQVPVLNNIEVTVAPPIALDCGEAPTDAGGDGDGDTDGGTAQPPGPCSCEQGSGDGDASGPVFAVVIVGALVLRRRRRSA